MKTYHKSLDPRCLSQIETESNQSDTIEIIDSGGANIELMVEALKAQAKHGCLGESLAWLFVEEKDGVTRLLMKEDRANKGWLKCYSAVYFYICGWTDRCFYGNTFYNTGKEIKGSEVLDVK
jgi:hypothetical protein